MTLRESPKRGRPKKDDVMGQLAIRIPTALMEGIDEYSAVLQEQLPGLNISRADAARQLIAVGLKIEQRRLNKE